MGSVRKGQSATLAIHPVSARQPAAAEGTATRAFSEGLSDPLPESILASATAAADGGAASASQENGNSGEHQRAVLQDPHALPDTALRIQRVSFSPAGGASALAGLGSSEAPAAAMVANPLQSDIGADVRGATSSFGGYEGQSAASGEQHRAAMPEGTLGVAAADLDGLAAESQVRELSTTVHPHNTALCPASSRVAVPGLC